MHSRTAEEIVSFTLLDRNFRCAARPGQPVCETLLFVHHSDGTHVFCNRNVVQGPKRCVRQVLLLTSLKSIEDHVEVARPEFFWLHRLAAGPHRRAHHLRGVSSVLLDSGHLKCGAVLVRPPTLTS